MSRAVLKVRLPVIVSMLFLTISILFARGSSDRNFEYERHFSQGDAELTFALSKESITTAENLETLLTVTLPAGGEAGYPEVGGTFGDFYVDSTSEAYPKLLENGLVVYEKSIILKPFLPGTYSIPEFIVTFTLLEGGQGEFRVPPQTIEVLSVLPEGAEPYDLLQILQPANRAGIVSAVIISVVVLIAAGVVLHRRLKMKRLKKHRSFTAAPLSEATKEIDILLSDYGRGTLPGDQVYAALSSVLRRFVEHHLGFRAPEQTTEEFLEDLARSDVIDAVHKHVLEEFLSRGDLVKFAGYMPMDDEITRAAETIKDFIDLTGNAAEQRTKENGEDG